MEIPNLVGNQISSFKWLIKEGLKEIFDEFSPIKDYSGKKFELEFTSFEIAEPKFDEYHAKDQETTYEAPLRVKVKLTNKILGTSKEQEIFMADVPCMTAHGTFIINGVERVVVPQLARSFGVLFTANEVKGKKYFGAKIIPARGAWMEVEADPDGTLYARIDKKRRFPAASLIRVRAKMSDEKILKLFKDPVAAEVMKECFAKDTAKTLEESYMEIHKRLRDGEMATPENAKEYIESIFSAEKYDLSPVGRFRFNRRFGKGAGDKDEKGKTLSAEDIATIFTHIVELENTPDAEEDNIDHLGSRRVRYFGEMMQQKVRVGMTQMKRNIQDRMSTIDTDTTLPIQFISPRPLQARIKEFFTTNQLSQFMNQENVLAEIEHLRTLSALGPGGLTRERAGLEVRDVHPSHYGRVCPIHTPEGPNIGLILHLSTYARIDNFGMIETPYAKVKNGKVTKEIMYLNAFEEEKYKIAHGATPYDKDGNILSDTVEIRKAGRPEAVSKMEADFIDIAPNQAFSIATSMIPFLEHDDANRALMGSNMQKQAVPCIVPEAPLVATGIEGRAARDTGRLILAIEEGVVTKVDARKITVKGKKDEYVYKLVNFSRTNSFTVFHQRPIVSLGDKVKKAMCLPILLQAIMGRWHLDKMYLSRLCRLTGPIMKTPSFSLRVW